MDAVTVIGGGGGAGATTVAAELAIALATLGRRVGAIDADLGLGNLDALLGVQPSRSLGDVIAARCTLGEALASTPEGVRVVAAGRCQEQPHALTSDERHRLIEQIDAIAADLDVLIVDAGTGVTPNTVFFAGVAQRIVLVASPAADARHKALAILSAVTTRLPKASIHILINRSRAAGDGRHTFAEIVRLTEPTLCADLHYLGALPFDEPMSAARDDVMRRLSFGTVAVRGAAEALAVHMFSAGEQTRGGLWLSPR